MEEAHRKRVAARRLNQVLGATPKASKSKSGTRKRPGVSLRLACANSKLAKIRSEFDRRGRARPIPIPPYVAATYVSIQATCPEGCFFKDNGCYPQTGFTGWMVKKLDEELTPEMVSRGTQVIENEAQLIESTLLPNDGAGPGGGRDLRLHVSGEVTGPWAARRLGEAAETWRKNGNGLVWTYTHRWKELLPWEFGSISALASCETEGDIQQALDEGWVPAVVVQRFPSDKAFRMARHDFIPCPAQTRDVPCVDCRLCMDSAKLHKLGKGIAFEAHGRHAKKLHLPLAPSGSQSGGSR